MSSEIDVLVLYGLLTVVVLLIQVLLAIPQVGLAYLATPRDERRTLEGVAGRSLRCLENSIVAMALFAPAVLVLNAQGVSTTSSLWAAQLFLFARVAYVPIYLMGIPWLRTGVWLVGFLATAYLYFVAL
ncbi:MAG: MAPEG family protein [Boseongicola sp.]|nr:MAPEG family protein [Boseongicola sp.]MDD9976371.1 MAPEG family protein [Boseongicola sp.]